jgi:hypothetical protein
LCYFSCFFFEKQEKIHKKSQIFRAPLTGEVAKRSAKLRNNTHHKVFSFVLIRPDYYVYNYQIKNPLTAVFFKLVQCQSQLNCEIHPFVVEGIYFTHT